MADGAESADGQQFGGAVDGFGVDDGDAEQSVEEYRGDQSQCDDDERTERCGGFDARAGDGVAAGVDATIAQRVDRSLLPVSNGERLIGRTVCAIFLYIIGGVEDPCDKRICMYVHFCE